MTTLSVMFADASKATITSCMGEYTGNDLDPEVFPLWGIVESNDARYKTFYDACPEFMHGWLPTLTT